MAVDHVPTADGTDLTEVPAVRLPSHPPPCHACPKWDGVDGERGPLDGTADLFAAAWFHDCRDSYREGRAVGDFGDPDPFTRSVYALFDESERRADRRATGHALADAVARLVRR